MERPPVVVLDLLLGLRILGAKLAVASQESQALPMSVHAFWDTHLCDLKVAVVRLAIQRATKKCLGNEEAQERVVLVGLVSAQEIDSLSVTNGAPHVHSAL